MVWWFGVVVWYVHYVYVGSELFKMHPPTIGAVEAVFAVLALHHQRAPGTVNLSTPDPPLLRGLLQAGQVGQLRRGGLVMSNSFGFGGTNTSLVFAPCG